MWFKRKKEVAPIETAISKITMGPKDILVFTVPGGIPPFEFDNYARRLGEVVAQTKTLDRNRVWVVPANLKITVLSPGTPEYELIVGNKHI